MRRSASILPLAVALAGAACNRENPPAPTPRPRPAASAPRGAGPTPDSGTDLPPEPPERLEVELRRRAENGDDTVLKLTSEGARYGLARGSTRVTLRFALPPAELDSMYETLRQQAFDRIETERSDAPPERGTSLRVIAGPGRYAASTLGRSQPPADQLEAYERCVTAVDARRPHGRSETVVYLYWDPALGDRANALDIDVGEDLVGLHRVEGSPLRAALHLARPRPLEVTLRHGTPARSTTQRLQAGRDHGLEVAYDPEAATIVLRPRARPPVAGSPSPAAGSPSPTAGSPSPAAGSPSPAADSPSPPPAAKTR